jgi:hypothetical protein
MQGIRTYIPEANYVPREYSVAAILLLLFMVHISLAPVLNLLYFYISTFQCPIWLFSASPWLHGFLVCCACVFWMTEIVPIAPIITGITFVFTFHKHCISIVRSLYYKIFLASFFVTFLSPEIATSINMHILFSLSRIVMSGV